MKLGVMEDIMATFIATNVSKSNRVLIFNDVKIPLLVIECDIEQDGISRYDIISFPDLTEDEIIAIFKNVITPRFYNVTLGSNVTLSNGEYSLTWSRSNGEGWLSLSFNGSTAGLFCSLNQAWLQANGGVNVYQAPAYILYDRVHSRYIGRVYGGSAYNGKYQASGIYGFTRDGGDAYYTYTSSGIPMIHVYNPDISSYVDIHVQDINPNTIGYYLQFINGDPLPKPINISTLQVSLSQYSFIYTGSRIEPVVTVYDSTNDYTLIQGTDYSVAYTNNVEPGIGKVVITCQGAYTGSKTLTFSIINETDPYDPQPDVPGGSVEPGGADGSGVTDTESVTIPLLPSLSSISSGIISIYVPTDSEMDALGSFLYTGLFDLDNITKLRAQPLDYIIGLSIVPYSLPYMNSILYLANVNTGINMRLATNDYKIIDCGTVKIEKDIGSYLDYAPYTKIEIYLPYIGYQQLNTDEVMGKYVGVVYHCDALTGACTAYVTANGTIIATFSGSAIAQLPLGQNSWTGAIKSAIDIGLTAATTIAGIDLNTAGLATALDNAETVNETTLALAAADYKNASLFTNAISGASANAINAVHPSVTKSGATGGFAGLLGPQKPFIVETRPNTAIPADQNKYTGYPSYINATLRTLVGYTEVADIHLDTLPATNAELAEILSILKNGFIIS